uniref:Zinc finger CCCH domain-containing protein 41 n=1 Tax=Tanacetum cinerariifolium TaxID=118510 RepID=A0A6L2N3C2_TANCI|nr:zinc finger CCCH domain-containing protein 41 [Tanacetum cinerariifolium]
MKLRVPTQIAGLSPFVYGSDYDDKEISDDDDDDRNHKHRRKEDAGSQSSADDLMGQVFTKPYRKGNKPFQNGHIYEETGSQVNETWKKYRFNPLENAIAVKFDQRRPGFTRFYRGPSVLNQKNRVNQPFSVDPGIVRVRGRDSRLWSQHDSRFSSSEMVQPGSVPRSLFAERGLPSVSNFYGPSWSSYGLVPELPNSGLDMHHPLGSQGTFRPDIDPSFNMGLARQWCRDFEEQGFCLRGDMCPMEHGLNRIVVEDVLNLSQFNLPVSLASENLSIAPVGTGPSPASMTEENTLLNSEGPHGKNINYGMGDNGLDLSGTSIDSASASDFYDPNQPLLGNDSLTSTGLQSISRPNIGKTDSLLDPGSSGDFDNEGLSNSVSGVGFSNTRSSGSSTSIRKGTEMGENMILRATPSNFMYNDAMDSPVPSISTQDPPYHHKRQNVDSSLKMQRGNGRMLCKPSQKAQLTLFVNGIPQQNNKRESLLSHFKKFGEVIAIIIPSNSEHAFVQFSKTEEAKAALLAPDAVMGNRFIKLWWANRDNIQDIETISGNNMSACPRGSTASSISHYIYVGNKRKDDPGSISHKSVIAPSPASNHLKPVVADNAKVPPPLQKKMESLEVLKEEIRKKQEMLDQKRSEFRSKLDKLAKQATGLKGEVAPEQVAKKQRLGVLADSKKAATPGAGNRDSILPSAQDEVVATSSKLAVPSVLISKMTHAVAVQELLSLKSSPFPSVNVGSPVVNNRFKLDNRPTAFKIVPPLPDGLIDVPKLKEHFSPYDLLKVQLDDVEPIEGDVDSKTSEVSACIYFTTRHAAEKAFLSSKSWKGHNLKFVWLNLSNTKKDRVTKEAFLPTFNGSSVSSTDPGVETSKSISQERSMSGDGESDKTEGSEVVKEST